MRKLLALALTAAGVKYVLNRRKGQQSGKVWKDATRPEL